MGGVSGECGGVAFRSKLAIHFHQACQEAGDIFSIGLPPPNLFPNEMEGGVTGRVGLGGGEGAAGCRFIATSFSRITSICLPFFGQSGQF